jgi:hypothetical protein
MTSEALQSLACLKLGVLPEGVLLAQEQCAWDLLPCVNFAALIHLHFFVKHLNST